MVAQQGTYEWAYVKLGEIGDVRMCKRIFADQTSSFGDIPFYKIGTFGKSPDAYISYELFNDYKERYSYPEEGDVLLSAAGTLGRTVVFDGKPSYFQDSNIVWLAVDSKRVRNDFLYYAYQVIQWGAFEGSTISRLYNEIIRDTELLLPPYKEQVRIAEALSDIDALIENLEKLIEKKKNIKTGIMQELLTGKRRLPGFDGEWSCCRLKDISKSVSGGTPSTQNASFWDGRVPWISSSDLISDSIDIASITRYVSEEAIAKSAATICEGPTIHVIVRVGLGKVAISQGGIATSQDFCNLIDVEGDVVFLGYFLMRQMCVVAKSAQGTSIQGINSRDLLEKEILLPSLEEQRAIAEVLSDMDTEISQLQEKLDKYKRLKAGMMDELLTGRIRLVD